MTERTWAQIIRAQHAAHGWDDATAAAAEPRGREQQEPAPSPAPEPDGARVERTHAPTPPPTTPRKTRQAWPDDVRERALELLRAGEGSTAAASRATGVPVPTLTRWARAEGIDLTARTTRTEAAVKAAAAEVKLTAVQRLERLADNTLGALDHLSAQQHETAQLVHNRPDIGWRPGIGGPTPELVDPEARAALARVQLLGKALPSRDLVSQLNSALQGIEQIRSSAPPAERPVIVNIGIPRPYNTPQPPIIDLGADERPEQP